MDIDNEMDVIEAGMSVLDDKRDLNTCFNAAVKAAADEMDLDAKKVRAYVRHRATYRRGWCDNCLEKENGEVDHADTVSAALRRVRDIVDVYNACGRIDELEEYFSALRCAGIDIKVTMPAADVDGKEFESRYTVMEDYIRNMWDKDAVISKGLAVDAEKDGIVPKGKFGKFLNMQYRINRGGGKTEKLVESIQHEKDDTLMYHDALETL